jgi:hypothetical protein
VLLGAVAVPRQRLQAAANGGRDGDGYSSAHDQDSHAQSLMGIPNRIQVSDFIH